MSAENVLAVLLANLRPEVRSGTYVFAAVAEESAAIRRDAVVTVREAEGLTVVLPRAAAENHGLRYLFEAAWITLTVHSALDAVGLTAAVATALARAGIPCNVVAGYHHDHLFVPAARRQDALDVLDALMRSGPR